MVNMPSKAIIGKFDFLWVRILLPTSVHRISSLETCVTFRKNIKHLFYKVKKKKKRSDLTRKLSWALVQLFYSISDDIEGNIFSKMICDADDIFTIVLEYSSTHVQIAQHRYKSTNPPLEIDTWVPNLRVTGCMLDSHDF